MDYPLSASVKARILLEVNFLGSGFIERFCDSKFKNPLI